MTRYHPRWAPDAQRSTLYIFLVILLSLPCVAWADEVHLANGDRLTGTVVKLEEESLTLSTSYAGDVTIDWKEVLTLVTDRPVTVQLEDQSKVRGHIVLSESGQLSIADPTTEATRLIQREGVAAINPPPDLRYSGDTSLGGNTTSGNTDTTAINASTQWTVSKDRHEFLFEGRYNYGERDNEVTVRNARGALNYAFFLSEKWFLNAEQLFEQDTFQELEVRGTSSGGVGYRFFNTSRHLLRLSGRFGMVLQQFKDRSIEKIPSGNWKLSWRYWIVPKKLQVFHKHQGFQDFGSESSAFRLNADQGFEVPVYKGLHAKFEYGFRFNSEPDLGRKKTDEAAVFSLGWRIAN